MDVIDFDRNTSQKSRKHSEQSALRCVGMDDIRPYSPQLLPNATYSFEILNWRDPPGHFDRDYFDILSGAELLQCHAW